MTNSRSYQTLPLTMSPPTQGTALRGEGLTDFVVVVVIVIIGFVSHGSFILQNCLAHNRVHNNHACMLFHHVRLFVTVWTITCQVPLSMGFCRQEYWSGSPCPPPAGDLPNPGIEPASFMSPALAGGFFTTSTTWETLIITTCEINKNWRSSG